MTKRPGLPFTLALAAGLLAAVVVVWPQGVGIHRLPVVANLVALRGILALGLVALAVVCALIAGVRRSWGVAAGLATALAVAALSTGGILAVRGFGGPEADADLTVVAWNAYGGGASPESIARLVRDTGADVVSLPETDADAAAEVVGILMRNGIRMRADTVRAAPGGEVIPTSILISEELGPYVRDGTASSTPGLPSGVWRPVDGNGPVLVAAHPMPPLPGLTDEWVAGLEWIAGRCDEPDVIVAGDLNATVDHLAGLGLDGGVVGGCRDAAADAGAAALGTWPVRLPPGLAAPIDHVLVGVSWRVRAFEVQTGFDDAGSDHRPVVARLSRG